MMAPPFHEVPPGALHVGWKGDPLLPVVSLPEGTVCLMAVLVHEAPVALKHKGGEKGFVIDLFGVEITSGAALENAQGSCLNFLY